jgi:hypothetical protein
MLGNSGNGTRMQNHALTAISAGPQLTTCVFPLAKCLCRENFPASGIQNLLTLRLNFAEDVVAGTRVVGLNIN